MTLYIYFNTYQVFRERDVASLSFLKQPAAPAAPVSSRDNIKPPIPRAPSPKKKVEEPKVSPAKSTKVFPQARLKQGYQ